MPIFEYKHKTAPKGCEDPFETLVMGTRKEPDKCPRCGKPVERVLSRFAQGKGDVLSDTNLKDKGFTKLVNEGGGRFRKTV